MEYTLATVCTVFVLAAFLSSSQAAEWGYLDDAAGPNNWTALYSLCGGSRQSPINIVTSRVMDKDLGTFSFVGFGESDQPTGAEMTVSNNGHSIVVALEGDYQVSGAGLGDTAYKCLQFHFHWGSSDSQGSEHTVNGEAYPGEMHIVCQNTKYADFGTALDYDDGLTVLGFFLEVQPADNPALAPLFDLVSMIQYDDDDEDLETPLIFENILPTDLSSFYRYDGSLTTPTCNEAVIWNVFTSPIMVSNAQLMNFRRQFANHEGASANVTLANTFRPVQPLNDRTVYLNTNSAPTLTISYSLISMVLIKVLTSVLED